MNREYIEKERALQLLEENASDDEVFFAARAIEAEPPADVKPVVRGEWIDKFNKGKAHMQSFCSACGKHSGIGGIESNRHKPFCPNCGADMRKEVNDERRVD